MSVAHRHQIGTVFRSYSSLGIDSAHLKYIPPKRTDRAGFFGIPHQIVAGNERDDFPSRRAEEVHHVAEFGQPIYGADDVCFSGGHMNFTKAYYRPVRAVDKGLSIF
jgi:hypothetical protein